VAFLAGTRIDILRLGEDGSLASTTSVFGNVGTRLRAVVMGPEGDLYVSTDGKFGGDEIWRVTAR
jgi:glucose/arabinose dehydrogenase